MWKKVTINGHEVMALVTEIGTHALMSVEQYDRMQRDMAHDRRASL